jgi:hypothetical protein
MLATVLPIAAVTGEYCADAGTAAEPQSAAAQNKNFLMIPAPSFPWGRLTARIWRRKGGKIGF